MKKKISLSYILLSVLLAAAILFAASCSSADEEETAPPEVSYDDLSGCLFIGDSRTYGLEMTNSLPGADFFCKTGWTVFDVTEQTLTVDGVNCSLDQLLSSKEYDKVYILLGINEISADLDAVTEKYSELITLIRGSQPGAKVIVEANLHVTAARSAQGDAFNNENIDLLNQKLYALTDGSEVCWLDANQILDGADGGLSEAYAEGDGIHPNWNCYTMWGEWIVTQNRNY